MHTTVYLFTLLLLDYNGRLIRRWRLLNAHKATLCLGRKNKTRWCTRQHRNSCVCLSWKRHDPIAQPNHRDWYSETGSTRKSYTYGKLGMTALLSRPPVLGIVALIVSFHGSTGGVDIKFVHADRAVQTQHFTTETTRPPRAHWFQRSHNLS